MAKRFTVETVFKMVDKVTAPVSRMQNRVGKFTRSMTRGLNKANRALGKVVKGLKRGASMALKFGGLAVAAGVAAFALALNKVANSADNLAKITARLKFPIEEFQEWRFVAEQSGLTTEEFDKSIQTFTKAVGEARAGTGTMITILKKTNPELLKQITSTESVAESYDLYLEALRGTENQLDKTALATAGFGRKGAKFLNITKQSAKEIAKLRREMRENGVVTREQAAAAEKYNDATNSLKLALTGLLNNVLLPMLPKITETVKAWRAWIVSNKELITSNIVTFLLSVKTSALEIFEAIKKLNAENSLLTRMAEIVTGVAKAFEFLVKHGEKILLFVAGILALSAAVNVASIAMAAFNLVMKANPFALMIIGATAAIALIATLLSKLELFQNIGSFIGEGLFNLFNDDPFENSAAKRPAGKANGSPQVVSPPERVARSIEETRTINSAEVTILDQTGRAKLTGGKLGNGLQLQQTGAM